MEVIDGQVDAAERHAIVRRFTRDPKHAVLLISIKAGAVGLNLQVARTAIFVEMPDSAADLQQAAG